MCFFYVSSESLRTVGNGLRINPVETRIDVPMYCWSRRAVVIEMMLMSTCDLREEQEEGQYEGH